MRFVTFFLFVQGQRKSSVAEVKITKPGTGNVIIRYNNITCYDEANCCSIWYQLLQYLFFRHKDSPHYVSGINYFFALKDRHQLLYPLQFTKVCSCANSSIPILTFLFFKRFVVRSVLVLILCAFFLFLMLSIKKNGGDSFFLVVIWRPEIRVIRLV